MRTLHLLRHASILLVLAQGATPEPVQTGLRPYAQDLQILVDAPATGTRRDGIADLITDEKGRIYTVQSGGGQIRVFDVEGKFLRSFGKKGDGAGEFAGWLQFATTTNDAVVIVDGNHNVLNTFGADGAFRSMIQVEGAWADRNVVTPLQPDRVLMRTGVLLGGLRESISYVITDTRGRLLKGLARDADAGNWGVKAQDGSGLLLVQPFLHVVRGTTDHSGARGVLALPHGHWNGQPGEVKLQFINREGVDTERVLSFEARKVTKEDVDAWVTRTMEYLKTQAGRKPGTVSPESLEKQVRDGLVVGDYWPAVAALKFGRDGSIWIRPSWRETDWTVHAPTGTKTFTFRAPAGTRTLYDVSLDRFWTVTMDSAGRSVATRYGFTTPFATALHGTAAVPAATSGPR